MPLPRNAHGQDCCGTPALQAACNNAGSDGMPESADPCGSWHGVSRATRECIPVIARTDASAPLAQWYRPERHSSFGSLNACKRLDRLAEQISLVHRRVGDFQRPFIPRVIDRHSDLHGCLAPSAVVSPCVILDVRTSGCHGPNAILRSWPQRHASQAARTGTLQVCRPERAGPCAFRNGMARNRLSMRVPRQPISKAHTARGSCTAGRATLCAATTIEKN